MSGLPYAAAGWPRSSDHACCGVCAGRWNKQAARPKSKGLHQTLGDAPRAAGCRSACSCSAVLVTCPCLAAAPAAAATPLTSTVCCGAWVMSASRGVTTGQKQETRSGRQQACNRRHAQAGSRQPTRQTPHHTLEPPPVMHIQTPGLFPGLLPCCAELVRNKPVCEGHTPTRPLGFKIFFLSQHACLVPDMSSLVCCLPFCTPCIKTHMSPAASLALLCLSTHLYRPRCPAVQTQTPPGSQ